jgi:hypothetical protein
MELGLNEQTIEEILRSFRGVLRAERIKAYNSGWSGFPVFAVNFTSNRNNTGKGPPLEGIYIVKIGTKDWAANERTFYKSHAASSFAPYFAKVEAVSREVAGYQAVAYHVAFGKFSPALESLANLLSRIHDSDKGRVRQICRQLESVALGLYAWNEWDIVPHRKIQHMPVHALIREMLGPHANDLSERLRTAITWWDQESEYLLTDSRICLPNPLAFLREDLWEGYHEKYTFPTGYIHGDLHTGNILCLLSAQNKLPLLPCIIDFESHSSTGFPFFDLAYLEFDVIHRALSLDTSVQRQQWLQLTDFIMSGIIPERQSTDNPLLNLAWKLIQPIRNVTQQICKRSHSTHADGYEIAWWSACVAVGLNYARKGDPERTENPQKMQRQEDRVAALLYAAAALHKLLSCLNYHPPITVTNALVVFWSQPRPLPKSLPEKTKTAGDGRLPPLRATPERTEDVDKVRDLVASESNRLVVLKGFPGVGKTTVAIEVGHTFLPRPGIPSSQQLFDEVIWIAPEDCSPKRPASMDVLRIIARRLDAPLEGLAASSELDFQRKVLDLLKRPRVLLILDDVHNIFQDLPPHDTAEWFRSLPLTVKLLVTTRAVTGPAAWHEGLDSAEYRLEGLSDRQAIRRLMERTARILDVQLEHINEREFTKLAEMTMGNPLAIEMAVGCMEREGVTLSEFIRDLQNAASGAADILDRLFDRSWSLLAPRARQTAMALTYFSAPASVHALADTMDLPEAELRLSLNLLRQHSLVESRPRRHEQETLYHLHPLVSSYSRARLRDEALDWNDQARRRWVEWYLAFTQQHGGLEWRDWVKEYDRLDAEWFNLRTVFTWCAEHGWYRELTQFWLENRVHRFAHIYGYWQDRLTWYRWIADAAQERDDPRGRAQAIVRLGFTLLQLGSKRELDEAEQLLAEAWEERGSIGSYYFCELLNDLILLHIKKERVNKRHRNRAGQGYDVAMHYVEEKRRLLDDPEVRNNLGDMMVKRQSTWDPYYRALIMYYSNPTPQAAREAGNLCLGMFRIAQDIHWERQIMWACDLGANLAMWQDDLPFAGNLLKQGHDIAQKNKDKRPLALFERGYARLFARQKDTASAMKWSQRAIRHFEELGMDDMASQMRRFTLHL